MKILLLLIAPFFVYFTAVCQPGFLDLTFGSNGIAQSPLVTSQGHGRAIKQQQDGKILIAGYYDTGGTNRMFLMRYNPDGTIDSAFNIVTSSFLLVGELCHAIELQPDGKIILAGETDALGNKVFIVARYLSSGITDTTFGNMGVVYTNFGIGTNNSGRALKLQTDGKILLGGTTFINSQDMALLRFNTDGSADSTFGIAGKVYYDITNDYQEGMAMELQPDGKIILAGSSNSTITAQDVLVVRFQQNGTPDSTFGTNGKFLANINSDDDAAYAVRLQPDGKIILSGFTYDNFTFASNLIMRLTATGILDSTFNNIGYNNSNPGGDDHISTGVLLQADGKIITTGRKLNSTLDFGLVRFTSDGEIDSIFGINGYVSTDMSFETDISFASTIQTDGKILLTGFYTDNGNMNVATTRYFSDSTGVSLYEINNKNLMKIWPQPASGYINLEYEKSTAPAEIEIRIYSITGQLLMEMKSTKNPELITVSELPSGMYTLEIKNRKSHSNTFRKFLKN